MRLFTTTLNVLRRLAKSIGERYDLPLVYNMDSTIYSLTCKIDKMEGQDREFMLKNVILHR